MPKALEKFYTNSSLSSNINHKLEMDTRSNYCENSSRNKHIKILKHKKNKTEIFNKYNTINNISECDLKSNLLPPLASIITNLKSQVKQIHNSKSCENNVRNYYNKHQRRNRCKSNEKTAFIKKDVLRTKNYNCIL